jgi:hypothetical protein
VRDDDFLQETGQGCRERVLGSDSGMKVHPVRVTAGNRSTEP